MIGVECARRHIGAARGRARRSTEGRGRRRLPNVRSRRGGRAHGTGQGHRRRSAVRRRRRTPHAARPLPARTARQDRHRRRLRHQQLRRLHRAPRRPQREVAATCSPSRPTAHEVTTIEGLAQDGELHPVQEAFHECHALQCGFCTPGMIMQAIDLLNDNPDPTEDEIREGLEGNLCRCTGYHNIVRAVQQAAGRDEAAARQLEASAPMTATEDRPPPSPEIGKARRRKEDQRLITGRTRWTDNIVLPGMLHLAMVRSPFAHARITAIDTDEAKRAPDVVAVLTGADLGDEQGVLLNAWPITAGPGRPRRTRRSPSTRSPSPARSSPSSSPARAAEARDAAELVDVDYDELPAVLDLRGGAPRTRCSPTPTSAPTSQRIWSLRLRRGRHRRRRRRGHREGARRRHRHRAGVPPAAADPGVHGAALGRRRPDRRADHHVVGHPDPAHPAVRCSPPTTGMPERKIRVIAPDVGGGFGGKLQVTPEECIAFAVARRLGKPVKYTETRSRVADGGPPRPRPVAEARPSPPTQGRHGHRPQGRPARRPRRLPRASSAAASRCSARSCSTRSTSSRPTSSPARPCFTNKTWTDAYRGAGRPEATFAIERIMDELAAELGVDPLEVREKNWIKHEEFPFTTVAGLEYDSGNYEAATAQGQGAVRLRRAARRAEASAASRNDPVQLGIGISTFTEMCGLAPVPGARLARLRRRRLGARGDPDAADRQGRGRHRRRRRTARATRRRGARSSPTGSACRSRTSRCCTATPRSRRKGLDTYGSRSLVVGGEARGQGRRQGDREGQADRGAPARGLRRRPRVHRRPVRASRAPTRASAIAEVALADVRRRTTCPTASSRRSTPTRPTTRRTSPSRTARTCARWRSTPRPGGSTMRKYVCVDDIGNDHQPADRRGPGARRPRPGHRAGAVGGGRVRRRRAPWSPARSSTTSADRGRHDQLRHRPHRRRRRRRNTLGTKGVGEAGTIASTPAVVNAVVDAVRPPRRQRHRDAVHAGAGLEGDPGAQDGADAGDAGDTHSTSAAPRTSTTRTPPTARKERSQ